MVNYLLEGEQFSLGSFASVSRVTGPRINIGTRLARFHVSHTSFVEQGAGRCSIAGAGPVTVVTLPWLERVDSRVRSRLPHPFDQLGVGHEPDVALKESIVDLLFQACHAFGGFSSDHLRRIMGE